MKRNIKSTHALIALFFLVAICATGTESAHASQKARARASQRQVEYACPMHPEVKAKRPGTCPKCKMDLRRVSVAAQATVSDNSIVTVPTPERADGAGQAAVLRIPDTPVLDQDGRKLNFYSDLVKGKTVAIDFIFTTCNGVCPTMTAKFRQLQQALGERVGRDIQLISISVDPTTDVPARLHAYAEKFHAAPGWSFVTGDKPQIDALLRALGAFAPDKTKHPQTILIGNEGANYWTRTLGLSATKTIAEIVTDAADKDSSRQTARGVKTPDPAPSNVAATADGTASVENTASTRPSADYFPNHLLLTQDNKPVRFYNDMLKDKVVLINFMFTTCQGVCSPMTANLLKVQQYLGDRVGRDINMITITVDPTTDTVRVLKDYTERFKIKPGWYFLTGKKENVDWVLYKVGGYVKNKAEHTSMLVMGNDVTGEWVKLPAMASPADIANAAIKLADSKGDSQADSKND
ncbi:MAG TPA: SCO family protein [Pyrinomonadaceae bacterium]|nr:SCO family protein [Pyrinomonadaceae bacterium]